MSRFPPLRRRHAIYLVAALAVLVALRAMLPFAVRDYVNRELERIPGYRGHVQDVHMAIWRGAYELRGMGVHQLDSPSNEPLFSSPRVEVSVLWSALLRGNVVASYRVFEPQINFVAGHDGQKAQTGKGADWIGVIKKLSFLRIDRFETVDGQVHYSDPHSDPPVNIALTRVSAVITNLTNSESRDKRRAANLELHALAADQAGVAVNLEIDPFAPKPDFRLKARLTELQVTRLRDFMRAYTVVDPKSGTLDVVTLLNAHDGAVKGYVKPLFHHLELMQWKHAASQEKDPLHFIADAIGSVFNLVLQNQDKQQLATVAPIEGRLDGPDVDVITTLGNLLKNAAIQAFTPTFEHAHKDD
ncbi:MAG TPA: DUF748 domain-containing protein [Nevskia sp.]|nr:DUF748 domain-containing protein [Nevskia sp.]